MFAQTLDGSVAYASGDGRQTVLSAAAALEQQQRILQTTMRADRARERVGAETQGRVAEREFVQQYNAQDLDQQQRIASSSKVTVSPSKFAARICRKQAGFQSAVPPPDFTAGHRDKRVRGLNMANSMGRQGGKLAGSTYR